MKLRALVLVLAVACGGSKKQPASPTPPPPAGDTAAKPADPATPAPTDPAATADAKPGAAPAMEEKAMKKEAPAKTRGAQKKTKGGDADPCEGGQ